jgi:hypothetical protein
MFKIKNVTLIEKDWLELKQKDLPKPIDIIHIQQLPGDDTNKVSAILNTIYPFLQPTSIVLAEYFREDTVKQAYFSWIKNKEMKINYHEYKNSDNLSNGDQWWGGLGAFVLTKKEVVA